MLFRSHVNNAHEFDTSEKINGFYFDTAYEYGNAYDKVQNSFIKYGYKFPRNYTKKCGCAFEMPNTFLVDCDLKLYFCTSSEKDDFFCQGYINDEGEICTNENYLKRRNLSVFHDDECKNCIFLPMCMGGCNYCRMKSEKYCIPEKYFFDDFVKKLFRIRDQTFHIFQGTGDLCLAVSFQNRHIDQEIYIFQIGRASCRERV